MALATDESHNSSDVSNGTTTSFKCTTHPTSQGPPGSLEKSQNGQGQQASTQNKIEDQIDSCQEQEDEVFELPDQNHDHSCKTTTVISQTPTLDPLADTYRVMYFTDVIKLP